jgi:uncharacterized membrane protein
MHLRLLFAVLYLALDLVYVFLSKSYYENVAKSIQGKGFPPSRWLGGVLAYVALVVGWWFFATTLAHQFVQEKGWSPFLAGAAAGALYGAVVYGVFNGTVYVMFEGYTHRVFLRDVSWGIFSASLITAIYSLISYKH